MVFYIIAVISWIIWVYCLLLVINAIMSWLPFLANSFVGRLLNKLVEPYLSFFRKGPIARLSYSTGIDISPIVGLLVLYFIQDYVLQWIQNILIRV